MNASGTQSGTRSGTRLGTCIAGVAVALVILAERYEGWAERRAGRRPPPAPLVPRLRRVRPSPTGGIYVAAHDEREAAEIMSQDEHFQAPSLRRGEW